MKRSQTALLVTSILVLGGSLSTARAASVSEKGALPPQAAIQMAKNVNAYFASPSPDISVIQGAVVALRGIDVNDPVAEASVAPIVANIQTAAGVFSAPSAAMSEGEVAAAAEKVGLLDTVLRPYLAAGQGARIAELAQTYRAAVSESRRAEIAAKMSAIAKALGTAAEDSGAEAGTLALGPYRAGPAPLPARGSYTNRDGFSGPVDGYDLQFKKWKALMSFRHNVDKESRFDHIMGTVVPAATFPVLIAIFGAISGHVLSALAAALALGGLSYYGLVKLKQSWRRRGTAANAAADAAEEQLGFPVNVDEIPVTPEEIHEARKLYEFGRKHPETHLMD